jgi:hypothetical protein
MYWASERAFCCWISTRSLSVCVKQEGKCVVQLLGTRPRVGPFLAGQDVGEDLGDRGAAVDLLPLLHQGGPDALFEAAFLAQAAGRVAHQDGRGPTGRSLKVLDEGVGGGGHVAEGAVEEADLLFLVHDHAAVDGAAQVVGLEAFAQVALVAGGDAVEQAGDLVDEDVGVGRHRLEAGHSGLVALEGVPHELEYRLAPAGVAGAQVPGQVQAVEAGDARVVDADVDVVAVLLGVIRWLVVMR